MVRSLVICAAAVAVLTFAEQTNCLASSFVADDSYAGIPTALLKSTIDHVSARFSSGNPILFAELRTVKQGVCGLVNASLEYKGYIPFFFEPASSTVRLGKRGRIKTNSAAAQIKQCR
jgi:hypothetical protein